MQPLFDKLGLTDINPGVFDGEWRGRGVKLAKISTIDGRRIGNISATSEEYNQKGLERVQEAYLR